MTWTQRCDFVSFTVVGLIVLSSCAKPQHQPASLAGYIVSGDGCLCPDLSCLDGACPSGAQLLSGEWIELHGHARQRDAWAALRPATMQYGWVREKDVGSLPDLTAYDACLAKLTPRFDQGEFMEFPSARDDLREIDGPGKKVVLRTSADQWLERSYNSAEHVVEFLVQAPLGGSETTALQVVFPFEDYAALYSTHRIQYSCVGTPWPGGEPPYCDSMLVLGTLGSPRLASLDGSKQTVPVLRASSMVDRFGAWGDDLGCVSPGAR